MSEVSANAGVVISCNNILNFIFQQLIDINNKKIKYKPII